MKIRPDDDIEAMWNFAKAFFTFFAFFIMALMITSAIIKLHETNNLRNSTLKEQPIPDYNDQRSWQPGED